MNRSYTIIAINVGGCVIPMLIAANEFLRIPGLGRDSGNHRVIISIIALAAVHFNKLLAIAVGHHELPVMPKIF